MFTATQPAAGVRVDPMPRVPSHLPYTQARNARRIAEGEGVMRPAMIVKAVGLGLPSTIKTIPSMVIPTHNSHPQTIRPGSKRRGHSKAPCNLGFGRPLRTSQSYLLEQATVILGKLQRQHLQVLRWRGDSRIVEAAYERNRKKYLLDFPQMRSQLDKLEDAHIRTVPVQGG